MTVTRSPFAIALAGAALLAAAMGIGRFAYTPLLVPLQATLGWTVAQAGDVASANFAGYLAGALLAAALVARADRHRWLLLGMVASVLTTAAGALADGYVAWLAIRALSGVASAFCLVIGTATVIAALARRGRPELGALHFAGVGLGIVVSVAAIEGVRAAGLDVHGQWAALGVVALLLLGGAWPMLRPGDAGEGTAAGIAALRPVAAPRLLVRLILAYGLFGFGYVVTATFIVAMARHLDGGAWLEPATWIAVGLLAAPSILAWQRVARRRGLFSALRFAFALEAAGVALAGLGSGHAALLAGGALLGATFMGITALGLLAGRRVAGHHQDRALGWMTAAFGLGQMLGPGVAGRLAEASGGFALPSLVAAALLVVGLLLLAGADAGDATQDEGLRTR